MKEKNEMVFNVLKKNVLCVVLFLSFFSIFLSLSARNENLKETKGDSLQTFQYYQAGTRSLRFGDFEGAVINFKNAISLGENVLSKKNPNISSFFIYLGVSYKNLGEYDRAIAAYSKAEASLLKVSSRDNPWIGYVYSAMGTIYKLKGDYVKDHDFQQAAFRSFSLDTIQFKGSAQEVKFNIADALFYLKKYDPSIKICIDNIPNVDLRLKSFYYSLLARIYDELGEKDLTNKFYQSTFRILKEWKGEDSYDLGLEFTNYATFLLKVGEYDEALKYNKLAETLVAKYFTTKSLQFSYNMLNFADYYYDRSSEASNLEDFHTKRKEDLEKALDYCQQALVATCNGYDDIDLSSNPELNMGVSQIQLLDILKKKANCLETLADLNLSGSNKSEAIENYQLSLSTISLATELIHQIRTGYESEESRLFLAENQESTFVESVGVCYKLFQQTNDAKYAEKGFEFAEKSKSASFLAAVKDSKAKEFGGIPDSLLKKEDYLKLNISNYKEMLFEEEQNDSPDSAKIQMYNSRIFQWNEQYDELVQLFEKSYPKYYSFKYQDEVVGVDKIRNNISGKTAVVEYVTQEPSRDLKEGQLFKFVITDNSLIFKKKVIDSTFVNDIQSVYQFLTSNKYLFTGLKEYKTYTKSAFRLYNILLQGETDVIRGKELIVIPDDKLDYIPFDALLSQMPDTTKMNFRNLPYLVDDYSISYTYSATLLFDYFEKDKVADKDLLAFAPSYDGDNRDYTASVEYRSGLSPLPAVSKEVDYIHQYVHGDVFKDSMAQESRFKKLAPDYDILHLAMHTIINDSLPMYSKLAFSKPNPGEKDDGWLNTSEIYTMNLKARMAVLSACNTGSGKLQKGEGVMSLARGFLYAGCPSIVMTLWEVEDESGANIMKDFYRFLSKGKSKTEALREAKLEHIKNADPLKAHPHYWLGYVVVGNPDPLYVSKDIYFVLVIFVLLILIIADQVYRKRKAR